MVTKVEVRSHFTVYDVFCRSDDLVDVVWYCEQESSVSLATHLLFRVSVIYEFLKRLGLVKVTRLLRFSEQI